MLRSILIAFWRSFTRRPLYAALNLLGLSLGVAAFLTLSLLYRFETSYESWTLEREKIYAAAIAYNLPGMSPDRRVGAMGGLLDELKTDYPDVQGVRDWSQSAIVHKGAAAFTEQIELVDADFLAFFKTPLLAGDAATALRDPGQVAISQETARKYFGTDDVMGRRLEISDADGRGVYTISAVIKTLPKNTDAKLELVRLLTPARMAKEQNWHNWGSAQLATYFKFPRPEAAKALEAQLPALVDRRLRGKSADDNLKPHDIMRLSFVPLRDVHLIDAKQRAAITTLGLVGMVALGLALINYVNLATARAGLRAREVAVRKTLGAGPTALRMQFLGEAALTITLAFLVGLAIVELALPVINAAGGLSLGLNYRLDGPWLASVFAVVLTAGLLAAIYPAFLLAGFKPAQVLASNRAPGGGRFGARLREGLVVFQFAAVVAAFILMLGFLAQIRHMQSADFGYRRDGLYLVTATRGVGVTAPQRQAFWAAARGIPGVTAVAASTAAPADEEQNSNASATRLDRAGRSELEPTLNWSATGPDYFQTLGTSLVAGRFLDAAHGGDEHVLDAGSETVLNVLISRAAVRQLDYASPEAALDKLLQYNRRKSRIVGVVEDVRFYSPTEKVPGKLYTFNAYPADWPADWPITLVRYSGIGEADARARLEAAWRRAAPGVPFEGKTAVANLDRYYKPQRDRSNLFSLGAAVGAGIGCIGLYGLAAFNTSRRTREVGVRKVLGASREQVAWLLISQFLRPVLIACLLAWPLAYWALRRWLSQFDDPIAVDPAAFIVGAAAAVAIGLVAVGGLGWAAASTEPGKALRTE